MLASLTCTFLILSEQQQQKYMAGPEDYMYKRWSPSYAFSHGLDHCQNEVRVKNRLRQGSTAQEAFSNWVIKGSNSRFNDSNDMGPCTFGPFVRRHHPKTNCHSWKSISHYSFWNFRLSFWERKFQNEQWKNHSAFRIGNRSSKTPTSAFRFGNQNA